MATVTAKTIYAYDYPDENGIIAIRRDYDCVENRLLDYLVEYLNKINFSGDENVFFGQSMGFQLVKSVPLKKDASYRTRIKKYIKENDYVSVGDHIIVIEKDLGDLILRTHKIREMMKKIKNKRINKL